MRSFKILNIIILISIASISCSREIDVQYQLNEVDVFEAKSQKIKAKNEAEYISILYTNLFQQAISPVQLFQSQNVLYSIGDQNVAKEMLLSNYFNRTDIQIPSDIEMRLNLEKFIIDTYKRFLLRLPSEGEKSYFMRYIQARPNLSVEMVYTAFAASDEYNFY
jgi:hypothetical protein